MNTTIGIQTYVVDMLATEIRRRVTQLIKGIGGLRSIRDRDTTVVIGAGYFSSSVMILARSIRE